MSNPNAVAGVPAFGQLNPMGAFVDLPDAEAQLSSNLRPGQATQRFVPDQ